MKVGDLVSFKARPEHPDICECPGCLQESGIVLEVDNSHRQVTLTLLTSRGTTREKVWVNHVEIASENR